MEREELKKMQAAAKKAVRKKKAAGNPDFVFLEKVMVKVQEHTGDAAVQ